MDEKQVHDAVSTELAAFRKHLTAVHLSTQAFVAIILVLVGLFAWHTMSSYNEQLGRAEAQYEQVVKDNKALQQQIADDAKQRAANDKQVQVIVKEVAATNKKADDTIKTVTAPDRTQQQVAQDSQNYLGVIPTVTPDGLFGFHAPAVQQFIGTKIDRDRLESVDKQLQVEVDLSHRNEALATKDLSACQTSLSGAVNAGKQALKVAKKGRWARFGGVVEKVGLFVGGIYLGHKLAFGRFTRTPMLTAFPAR